MGRDVKSIVGSTSVGATVTKYKGWAIPIMRTTIKDVADLATNLKNRSAKETLTSREFQELYRAMEMTAVLIVLGSMILSEEDDDSFFGRLKARAYREAMTFLGGVDPTLFLSTPRVYNFLQKLAEHLVSIVKMETYKTDSQWGDEGDLKGLQGLRRIFTPALFRQFRTGGESESVNIDIPEIEIPEIEVPEIEIPEISL